MPQESPYDHLCSLDTALRVVLKLHRSLREVRGDGLCDDQGLCISVRMEEEVKNILISVTSFMDDPL